MNIFYSLILVICAGLAACTSSSKNSTIGQIVYPNTAIRAPACGGSPGQLEISGDINLARSLRGVKLVCKVGNLQSEGEVHEYARYKCMNSPSYLSLVTFGQRRVISNLSSDFSGAIVLISERVSNMSPDVSKHIQETQQTENITCVRADSTNSDNNKSILKISDFECQRKVHGLFWSKFLGDYNSKKRALNLMDMPNEIEFEIHDDGDGVFSASSLKIDGRDFTGKGTAKVEMTPDSCKVDSIKASIN